jgi:predicted RNA binding protein YcfA (HicA-like mRNA interferase family)
MPPSSSGPGHHPFKVKIAGSNPAGGTRSTVPDPLGITHASHERKGAGLPKAARVLAGLKRDGWEFVRRESSHIILRKGDQQRVFAFHDKVDLGQVQMRQVAAEFGYTVEQLRKL